MKGSRKTKTGARMLKSWTLSLLLIGVLMQISYSPKANPSSFGQAFSKLVSLAYGKVDVAKRYRIAVTLFNEAEYEEAEDRFSTVIQEGDLADRGDAAYVINSYYGRSSCRIEQGRKFKEERKLIEALSKYDEAYQDLSVFKSKFEELQSILKLDSLYDEMEKHFITIADQMVQLAGEAGDICARQGRYEAAVEWYDKGLLYIDSRTPIYGDILYAKADAVFQLDRYEETLTLLTRFESELSLHDKASNALLFAGDIHRILADRKNDQTHLEKALDVYAQVVTLHPEGADVDLVKTALLEKARSEKKLGRMEEAMSDFRKVQAYYPDTSYEVEAALEIGDYSFLAKRYNDAIQSFDRAVEVAKVLDLPYFSAISHYWIGWSYYREGARMESESSQEMAKSARKLYEESNDAFQDCVKDCEKFWKKEGRETQKGRELEDYYGESLYRVGRNYQALERWDSAIESFEKIPRVHKEWWLKGLAEIAVSNERKGDIESSLAKWDELKTQITLANVPNVELELLANRARSLLDLQRFDQAEKAYREIIVKYPDSPDEPEARVNLGKSLFRQGKDGEAIQEFSAMLSKYARNDDLAIWVGEALFWRGYLTARVEAEEGPTGNLKRAISDYRELVNRFPNHTRADDAQAEIGFCTYSLGVSDPSMYSEAIDEYSKVLQNYPESEYSDHALYEIGRCYRLLGDEAREEESLRRLIDDYPTSESADDALLRIAEIHFDRAREEESSRERQIAESTYNEIISKYPGTMSEALAHFHMGSILYKFDYDLQTAAMEFEKCAQVTERLLDRLAAGEYVPVDLDVAILANLLLRSSFWQGESLFQLAERKENTAQPPDIVNQAYRQARVAYQQLLSRGTRLRSDFPQATQNLYNIMGGENLDIPIIGEAQYMANRCLYKEGDLQGAKSGLQSIKSPEKIRLKAEIVLASIAYDQGDLVNAKATAESWLNSSTISDMADEYKVEIQVLLAKVAMSSENISDAKAQALDTWALFNSVDGLWEESAYIVARCYQKQNDLEKARSWFEKLQDSSLERWRVMAQDAILRLEGQ